MEVVTVVTKEDLAGAMGVKLEEVTDAMLTDAQNAAPEVKDSSYRPDADQTSQDTPPAEPVKSAGGDQPPAWKPPETWDKEHFVLKSELDTLDPGVVQADEKHPYHSLVKKILGDPLRDEKHPHHKVVLDARQTATKAIEEARLAKAEAAEASQLRVKVAQYEARQSGDDPESGTFGGLHWDTDTDQVIDGDGNLAQKTKWFDARDAYRQRVTQVEAKAREDKEILAEAERITNQRREKFATEVESFKKKVPEVDLTQVFQRWSPELENGKANPDYRELEIPEAVYLHRVAAAGGIEGYEKSLIDQGRKLEREELVKKGIKIETKPTETLTGADGGGVIPVAGGAERTFTEAEILSMPAEEYKQRLERGEFGTDVLAPPRLIGKNG